MDSDNDGEDYHRTKRGRSPQSDSEAEEDDKGTYRRSDSERKGRGSSTVPLKKRSRGVSRNDNAGSEEEDVGYGSDLYYDEEDREKLENMTQLEREMILSERSDKLLQAKEKRELLQKKKKPEADAYRSRGKGQDARRSAMEEIKAARERKARTEQEKRRSKSYDDDDDDYAVSDESDPGQQSDRDDEDRGNRLSRPPPSRETEREPEKRPQYAAPVARTDHSREGHEDAMFDDAKHIQVRRHKLEAWHNEPFFEDKIPGCLVRVSVPPQPGSSEAVYVVAKVEAVTDRPPGSYREMGRSWTCPYGFGPSGMKTGKWLDCRRGSSVRLFPMTLVSNSHFTEDEWDSYNKQCFKDDAPVVLREDVDKVKSQLMEAENHKYTAQDVQKIIDAKRNQGYIAGSMAAEKARLMRLKTAALEEERNEEAERLDDQIKDLDTRSATGRRGGGSKVAISEINKKNAAINFQNMFQNISNRPDGQKAAGGGQMGDAFSRRQTRPMTYWKTKKDDIDDLFDEGEGGSPPPEDKMAAADAKKALRRERFDPAADPNAISIDVDLTLLELSPLLPKVAVDLLGMEWQKTLSKFATKGGANQQNRLLTLTDYKRRQGI